MLDLSFRITSDMTTSGRELTVLPHDLASDLVGDPATLMVGIAARQAASSTARVQMILDAPPIVHDCFAPIDGSFNAAVARALAYWKHA